MTTAFHRGSARPTGLNFWGRTHSGVVVPTLCSRCNDSGGARKAAVGVGCAVVLGVLGFESW